MTYKLTLSYRGTDLSGWQRQPNGRTAQQLMEEALEGLLGFAVRVVGAGRTDAGVHARGQVAHLELAEAFPERGLVFGTNARLPPDVRVISAERVPAGFHARKHASGKLYRYRMVRCRVLSPLDEPFALRVDPQLDVAAMRAAASHLPGRHSFEAFALAGGAHTSPVRTLFSAKLEEAGADLWLALEGEGFLRGMVRSIVGTLLEVGSGRRTVASFAALLAGAPRSEAGPTAPALGPVLERVDYPRRWAPLPDPTAGPSPL